MAWTATITAVEPGPDSIIVRIGFSDGAYTSSIPVVIGLPTTQDEARQQIKEAFLAYKDGYQAAKAAQGWVGRIWSAE